MLAQRVDVKGNRASVRAGNRLTLQVDGDCGGAAAFVRDVRSGNFPGAAETVQMAPEEFAKLKEGLGR